MINPSRMVETVLKESTQRDQLQTPEMNRTGKTHLSAYKNYRDSIYSKRTGVKIVRPIAVNNTNSEASLINGTMYN